MADMMVLLSLLWSSSTIVTVELDKTITFTSPSGIMVRVKVMFGSRPISSSMIVTLTIAVDWPGENLIDWVTAV